MNRTINTTSGPVEVPKGTREHVVNTSRVTEEDMQYLDEPPEILAVLPGSGWCAVVGEQRLSLAAFVAMDSGRMYGVPVGEDGRINLVEGDVEDLDGFQKYQKYEQVNNNDSEEK